RAPALLAGRSLAAHALAGRARQHSVFRRHPAAPGIAHPARYSFLKACRAEHVRVAELDEARAFRMLGDAAFKGNRAHFVVLALGWTHEKHSPDRFGRLVTPRTRGRK